MSALTIGELARLAGTTVRAVRHYHASGMLAEPPRDASGYRRYGAQALVRLVRIRQLRDLGVPLPRVRAILDTDESFDAALDKLDAELAGRAAEIEAQRARLTAIRGRQADRELPAPLGELFAELAARGAGSDGQARREDLDSEKEAVLLLLALSPQTFDDLVVMYQRLLGDNDLAARLEQLQRRFDALASQPADSPAVEELVDALFADPDFAAELAAADPQEQVDQRTLDLFREYLSDRYQAAQRRFAWLALTRAQAHLHEKARSRAARGRLAPGVTQPSSVGRRPEQP